MAKHAKKKGKKPTRRRRRSMGALNMQSPKVNIAALAAGALGGLIWGDKINEQIDKIIPADKVDGKLVATGQVGLGSAYAFLVKKKRTTIVTGALSLASGVLIGSGIKRGMKEFGMGNISINGYQDVNAVNGYQDVNAVNGAGRRRRVLGNNSPGNGMGMNAQRVPIGGTSMLTRDQVAKLTRGRMAA